MNKNPFSIYEFLGYLFPGIVAFFLILFCASHTDLKPIADIFHTEEIKIIGVLASNESKEFDNFLSKWETTVLAVLISYIIGHLIAYLSSSIIEYFPNRLYGYPSHYLLCTEVITRKSIWQNYFKGIKEKESSKKNKWFYSMKWSVIIWRLFVAILMLPIVITSMIALSLNRFIVRPLDEDVIKSIKDKINKLCSNLKLDKIEVNSEVDFHRIIMHYVYLNIPNCQRKTDNYVAIYGFLRAMTLIACLLFDFLLLSEILYSLDVVDCCHIFNYSVDFKAIMILVLVFVICNVLYMAFVKFYRRFTLENYMALLTEK